MAIKIPMGLHVDMSRHTLRQQGGMRYMLNFEHNRGFTTDLLQAIEKNLNDKGCMVEYDPINFIKAGGVRTRLFTFDLGTMRQAIEILKRDFQILLTYRGKIAE